MRAYSGLHSRLQSPFRKLCVIIMLAPPYQAEPSREGTVRG